jgi:hypothetical protein
MPHLLEQAAAPEVVAEAAHQLGALAGMFGFTAHGRAIFAIERGIKHAGAKLLGHLRLQLQAFAHAHLDTAVVVAHGQLNA